MKKIYIVIETFDNDFNRIDRAFESEKEALMRIDLLRKIAKDEHLEYEMDIVDFVEKDIEKPSPRQPI